MAIADDFGVGGATAYYHISWYHLQSGWLRLDVLGLRSRQLRSPVSVALYE